MRKGVNQLGRLFIISLFLLGAVVALVPRAMAETDFQKVTTAELQALTKLPIAK